MSKEKTKAQLQKELEEKGECGAMWICIAIIAAIVLVGGLMWTNSDLRDKIANKDMEILEQSNRISELYSETWRKDSQIDQLRADLVQSFENEELSLCQSLKMQGMKSDYCPTEIHKAADETVNKNNLFISKLQSTVTTTPYPSNGLIDSRGSSVIIGHNFQPQ